MGHNYRVTLSIRGPYGGYRNVHSYFTDESKANKFILSAELAGNVAAWRIAYVSMGPCGLVQWREIDKKDINNDKAV